MDSYRRGGIRLLLPLLGFFVLTANFSAAQNVSTNSTGFAPILNDQTVYTLMMIGIIVNICLFAAVIALLITMKRDIKRTSKAKK